jgi:hypothetical protein
MKTYLGTFLGVLLLGGILVSSAAAQDTSTIRIEDGSVFINDQRVPDEDLPESLDISDLTAEFHFTSSDRAYLDLGGHVYMLENGRLSEIDRAEAREDVAVFFSSGDDGKPVRFMKRDDAWEGKFYVQSRDDGAYAFYGDALFDQARKMEELKTRLASRGDANIRVSELEPVVVELTAAAENTARMAEALPRIQFQTYLQSIGDRDSALLEELKREQQLEQHTRELAVRIRSSRDADEKSELTEELRSELATIFELKQKNREREIQQLAERLEDLQSRLSERQELRSRIIEARMNELLGRSDW